MQLTLVLREMRLTPLLWLLAFVPVVLCGEHLWPERHVLLFLLSVLAIVPLAALLSRATESVAARTGDAVGGLLNATLGNLTELVIAITALHAGQYLWGCRPFDELHESIDLIIELAHRKGEKLLSELFEPRSAGRQEISRRAVCKALASKCWRPPDEIGLRGRATTLTCSSLHPRKPYSR
jgi:hypothetical protein